MSNFSRFISLHWMVLSIHFILPFILIGPSIWAMNYPNTESKQVGGNWKPENPGELHCTFTNRTFWKSTDDNCWHAKLYAKTDNSTICPNTNLPYVYELSQSRCSQNQTAFENFIGQEYPTGQVFNCSVITDCAEFDFFRYPRYQTDWTPGIFVRIFGIFLIFMIFFLPITGCFFARRKYQEMQIQTLERLIDV